MLDRRRGFTILEALVAITLVSLGAIFITRGLGSMALAEAQARDRMAVNGLAQQKLSELITTEQYQGQSTGTFDKPNDTFSWTLTQVDTGITNLIGLQLTVTNNDKPSLKTGYAETLLYVPPTTTAATGATGGATGGTGGGAGAGGG